MQTFTTRRFLGIRNSVETSDQPRGAMRKAEGLLVTPSGALTGGPNWIQLWGMGDLRALILTALAGATSNKVHFVRVTRGASSWLIAWDIAADRDRGVFPLFGYASDPTGETGSITLTATNDAVWREKTASLRWFGSWINGQLWLGNGTDANLVYSGGALALLGPATEPADTDHPARFRFPPVKQWMMTADKVIYGAGNASSPLDVWATEKANALYPSLTGLLSLDTSFVRINHTRATTITAIASISAGAISVHTDAGTVIVSGFEVGSDAYKAQQAPTECPHGAINPNCSADTDGAVSYFIGRDRQLYRNSANRQSAYQKKERGESSIATSYAGDLWNADMAATPADDFAILHDRENHLVFLLTPLSLGRSGLYCYHEPSGEQSYITGPLRYPDFTSVCLLTCQGRTLIAGLTRAGAMLYADLTALVEADTWTLPAYTDPIGSDYAPLGSQPTPDAGLPAVGVNPTAGAEAFRQLVGGIGMGMAGPFSQWTISAPTVTQWFKNASVAIIEMANEDCGHPDVIKEFCQIRLQFQRNARAYVGVFAECDGRQYGRWRGTRYPREELLSGLKLSGRRLTVRIIIVYFNNSPFLLRGVSLDYNTAVAD